MTSRAGEDAGGEEPTGLEVAVIGMAGRFPGAPDVDALWENLRNGVESIVVFSREEVLASGAAPELVDRAEYVRAGGYLEGVDRFDAAFFGYSPREASTMDPQQRLFLETAWTALEHAGYNPRGIERPVGVYAGVGFNAYLFRHVIGPRGLLDPHIDHAQVVGNDKDFLATRVAYKLGLQGPSVVVQAACSTSLVAIHLACQGLLSGDCDMALAGGMTVRLPQKIGYLYQEEGISSPDGHCRAFSASARGCLPGNGGGAVVLKRLEDALADGDCIHAVVKGTAVNNDGSDKVGYTAPRVDSQANVIRAAQTMAEVGARSIGYVEAHGTGTLLGDPIEIEALTRAFRHETDATGFCAVGAIKTNLGHLDAGAGVAGFIKTVMAIEHRELPPSLHFDAPNPDIDFEGSPFYVNARLSRWEKPAGSPRRAGVSAFGIGGANAHAILEEPPAAESGDPARPCSLLLLSARSDAALASARDNLARYLEEHPGVPLADVAYTLQVGRQRFDHALSLACRDVREARDGLAGAGGPRAHVSRSATAGRDVVFLFPGQGSQHVGMGRGLYETEPAFRDVVDRSAEILAPSLGTDLRDVLYPGSGDAGEAEGRLADTRFAQPAIFVVEYALARLWMGWGARPRALIGHSIGEYAAACVAGVFGLEDALGLVAERGRLMSSVAPGAMLAVPLARAALEPRLDERLSLAAENGPSQCVVSGPRSAVDDLERDLQADEVACRRLHTSHAFHSAMMDPVLEAFARRVGEVALDAPRIPWVSNVSGTWIEDGQATDPAYWAMHLRRTVQFSAGLDTILDDLDALLVEAGPGQTLGTLARQHPRADAERICCSMRHPRDEQDDADVLLAALGRYWGQGGRVDWRAYHAGERRLRVPLPTYPFERRSYWVDATSASAGEAVSRRSTAKQADVGRWFHVPSWKRVPLPSPGAAAAGGGAWLVFEDASGLAGELAARARGRGASVFTVTAGARYARRGEHAFDIDAGAPGDYRRLLEDVGAGGGPPRTIVHCFGVEPGAQAPPGLAHVDAHLHAGFYSVLFLARALGARANLDRTALTVVTSHLHRVVGGERTCPGKAAVLGPCRTIPLEYPQIRCTSVDVSLPEPDAGARAALAERLLAEIDRGPAGAAVAYRGRYRWLQSYEPLRLDADGGRDRLKTGGVYLVTGGLGGVGLAVAEQLARTRRARLVLTGRRGLPPRSEWDEWLRPAAGVEWSRQRLAEIDARGRASDGSAKPPAFDAAVDRLCASHVLDYFRRAGVDASAGQSLRLAALRATLGIQPQFHRLLDAMLRMLVEDGLAAVDGDRVEFLAAAAGSPRPDDLAREAREHFPAGGPVIDLIGHCMAHYEQALRGDIPAIGVLYGAGGAAIFKAGVEAEFEHSDARVCHRLVCDLLDQVTGGASKRRLRMLEVGGGEGLLTRSAVPLLHGREVEYHFTDIGPSFVASARRLASNRCLEIMRFGTLDVASDPRAQGYEPASFDVVLAFNVVHATPRVEATLDHLSRLLAPGGLLVMIESIGSERWVDLVWGLTDGWWSFEDTDLRTASPLLGLAQWEAALERRGLRPAAVFPADAGARARTGLLVAEKPRAAPGDPVERAAVAPSPLDEPSTANRIRRVQALEALGAEVAVFEADVADPERMRTVIAQARERFGRIDGVVHAALVLDDGAIQLKEADNARRVLSPKVHGTLNLAELLRGSDLDFFVMFSSLVGVLGGSGQVDYCAASSFQDAFAQAHDGELAGAVISVDWSLWRETGKGLRAAVERGALPHAALPEGMTTEEGLDAFARVLRCDEPQVLVSTQPLAALLARARTGEPGPAAVDDAEPAPAAEEHPQAQDDHVAPRDDLEAALAGIWGDVLGIARIGVHDNIFDLGVDSVVTLQFIARAKTLGVELSVNQVFRHQSVAELAVAVKAGGGSADAGPAPGGDAAAAGAAPAPPAPAGVPATGVSQRDLDRVLERVGAAGGTEPR